MNYVNGNSPTTDSFKDSAKKSASSISSEVQKGARSGARQIEETAADLRTMAEDRLHELSESAREARDRAETYVKAHPSSSILGAAAIGLVAGALLTVVLRPSRS